MGHCYFVRHGQTVWNVENKICGCTDSPLTEYGREQARETGRKILAEGIVDIRKESKENTYILVAHNGIARVVQSYFTDMTNEEYAAWGVKNCAVVRYDF